MLINDHCEARRPSKALMIWSVHEISLIGESSKLMVFSDYTVCFFDRVTFTWILILIPNIFHIFLTRQLFRVQGRSHPQLRGCSCTPWIFKICIYHPCIYHFEPPDTTKKTKISEGYLVRENVKSLSNSVTKFCDQRICEKFHFFRH